jgi:hypothetical protein
MLSINAMSVVVNCAIDSPAHVCPGHFGAAVYISAIVPSLLDGAAAKPTR